MNLATFICIVLLTLGGMFTVWVNLKQSEQIEMLWRYQESYVAVLSGKLNCLEQGKSYWLGECVEK